MSQHLDQNCERFEAMMGDWFDGNLPAAAQRDLPAHLSVCASCRESFELSSRIEDGLVSRRSLVPPVDSFLPALAPAPARALHPRLVRVFRGLMSPAGIAAVLVMWVTMLTLHFRDPIGAWLTRLSTERLGVVSQNITSALLELSRGDVLTLSAIYVALALAVLASTGAITLRYLRNS